MAELARRGSPGHLSSLFKWLDAPWPSFWPMSAQTFRVADYTKDRQYVVRAELPGSILTMTSRSLSRPEC